MKLNGKQIKLATALIIVLLISSCANRKTPLIEGCMPELSDVRVLDLGSDDEATKMDYRFAAILRTQELLVTRKEYNAARKCIEVFDGS